MTQNARAERVDATLPAYHHKNPRKGDVEAIKASLEANGQFRPIVINEGTLTGRAMEVLAGNHTLKAIRQLAEEHPGDERWTAVDAWIVDVDDEAATRIVLADNKTADMAEYDLEGLMELLAETEDLEGTGYDDDDLDDLRAMQEELAAEIEAEQPTPEDIETPEQPAAETDTPVDLGGTQFSEPAPGHTPAEAPGPEATRMFAIHFPLAQFVWVQEALDTWHKAHPDADGANSIAVKELLEKAL